MLMAPGCQDPPERGRIADLDASRTPDAIRCETRGGSRLL